MTTRDSDTSHLLTIDAFEYGMPSSSGQGRLISMFRPLRTVPLAWIQILFNAILAGASFVLHFLLGICDQEVDKIKHDTSWEVEEYTTSAPQKVSCSSWIIYSNALVLLLTGIQQIIFKVFHRNHRRFGYLQLYAKVAYISEISFFVMSIGSVFLLVIVTMELDPASSFEIRSLPESTMLMFSQIVVCAEFLVVFISLLVYIVIVIRFNRSKAEPDVFRESRLTSMPLTIGARTVVEIGPGVDTRSEEVAQLHSVCERQADLIEYFRHRCDVISERLHQVTTNVGT